MSIVKNRPDVLKLIILLESCLLRIQFYVFIYTPKKFFIIPEAGVTTMQQNDPPLEGRMFCGKGK